MALFITDGCINCGYCAKECPNEAIYEPGIWWSMEEGTGLKGLVKNAMGLMIESSALQKPLSDKVYFIVPEKCTHCKGVYEEPQCVAVCPDPDSIIPHPVFTETDIDLVEKQLRLQIQNPQRVERRG